MSDEIAYADADSITRFAIDALVMGDFLYDDCFVGQLTEFPQHVLIRVEHKGNYAEFLTDPASIAIADQPGGGGIPTLVNHVLERHVMTALEQAARL